MPFPTQTAQNSLLLIGVGQRTEIPWGYVFKTERRMIPATNMSATNLTPMINNFW